MAKVGQGEIGDPHGIEGILVPQDDDYHEVIIGGNGLPNDGNESGDNTRSESEDGNNDQAHGDFPANPHGLRRPRDIHGPMGPVTPACNLHIKHFIFSANNDWDTESHILFISA